MSQSKPLKIEIFEENDIRNFYLKKEQKQKKKQKNYALTMIDYKSTTVPVEL